MKLSVFFYRCISWFNLRNRDLSKETQLRIRALPKKLEGFSMVILDSVEGLYYVQPAKTLRVCQANLEGQFPLITASFFDEADFLFKTHLQNEKRLDDEGIVSCVTSTERQVCTRCCNQRIRNRSPCTIEFLDPSRNPSGIGGSIRTSSCKSCENKENEVYPIKKENNPPTNLIALPLTLSSPPAPQSFLPPFNQLSSILVSNIPDNLCCTRARCLAVKDHAAIGGTAVYIIDNVPVSAYIFSFWVRVDAGVTVSSTCPSQMETWAAAQVSS